MVNVILEGCDCVGKSSIAEELLLTGRFDLSIKYNNPKDKEDGERQYRNAVNIMNTRDRIIFDRALLGECIYAPLKRGYYPEYMRDLEKRLSTNTYLFVITASLENVKKRFDHKFLRENQLGIVLETYKKEFEECNYKRKYMIQTDTRSAFEASNLICDIIDNTDKYKVGELY